MARVLVGTSGWTDETLIRCGRFYPPTARTAEARLRHYASRFAMVEVDATYYALPSRRNATLWAQRTPPGFVFNVKAFGALTGHTIQTRALPPEMLKRLLPAQRMQGRLAASELPEAMLDELAWRFVDGLQPLRAAGKLGWVLLQFPPWFEASRERARQVAAAARRLGGMRVGVEFRNASWASDENLGKTVAFLHAQQLALVCVDAPQGFVSSMPSWSLVTDRRLAVLRLHGRNASTWQAPAASAAARFHHRYSFAELAELAERVEAVAREADEVHVVLSNAHEDDAVLNAAELAAILSVEPTPLRSPAA